MNTLKELEKNENIPHREKVVIKMWIEKAQDEMRSKIRFLFANYRESEGCDCCRNIINYEKFTEEIGKILKVPKYEDSSGYDFGKFIGLRKSEDKK